jgi:hypothetical protein
MSCILKIKLTDLKACVRWSGGFDACSCGPLCVAVRHNDVQVFKSATHLSFSQVHPYAPEGELVVRTGTTSSG